MRPAEPVITVVMVLLQPIPLHQALPIPRPLLATITDVGILTAYEALALLNKHTIIVHMRHCMCHAVFTMDSKYCPCGLLAVHVRVVPMM